MDGKPIKNLPPISFDSFGGAIGKYICDGWAVMEITSDGVKRNGEIRPIIMINPYLIKTQWCGHTTWLAIKPDGNIHEINNGGNEFTWIRQAED